VIDDPLRLPQPGAVVEVPAPRDGIVADVDARQVGRVVLQLGGGRTTTDDVIDPAAGVDRLVQAGETVVRGQPLMRLLACDAARAEALLQEAAVAVQLSETAPAERKLVIEEVAPYKGE
jgi:thymidine phosphorylase